MVDENNLVTASRFDGDAYTSSQAAEFALNEPILRAEIVRGYKVSGPRIAIAVLRRPSPGPVSRSSETQLLAPTRPSCDRGLAVPSSGPCEATTGGPLL